MFDLPDQSSHLDCLGFLEHMSEVRQSSRLHRQSCCLLIDKKERLTSRFSRVSRSTTGPSAALISDASTSPASSTAGMVLLGALSSSSLA